MARWTKKAILQMQGAIDSFVLTRRPLGHYVAPAFATWVAGVLDTHRAEIVAGGLRGLAALAHDRAEQSAATAAHYRAHPEIYGPADKTIWDFQLRRRLTRDEAIEDFATRFDGYAADDRKGEAACLALVDRIAAEGLPAEVVAYNPMDRK